MDAHKDYFRELVELMNVLRGPNGCPWDKEQTRESLKAHLIEETYEVLDALERGDPADLCDELGDLLFQVIFHSRIAQEKDEFDIDKVCRRSHQKMVRRHPHIFGEATFRDSQDLLRHWEDIKTAEKEAAGGKVERQSLLDGTPQNLPAIHNAYQISAKAARVGFDWPSIEGLQEKLMEEFDELLEALERGDDRRVREEVGDLLFAALNVARYLQVEPETALKRANEKFSRRFRRLEEHFASRGQPLKEVSLEQMEAFWQTQKAAEKEARRSQARLQGAAGSGRAFSAGLKPESEAEKDE